MVIKKKTLYIVLPIVVIVILFTTIISYLMGWFGNTPKLDKYQSVSDICNIERKIFSVSIKCEAFLDWIEYDDNGSKCVNYSLVKDYSNLESLKLCDRDIAINTDNKAFDTDMRVPVYLNFIYKYKFPLSYTLDNVSMDIIEDSKISELLKKLSDNGINTNNVRTQEIADIKEKGYYFYESDKIIEGKKIGSITFVDGKINSISSLNGELNLNITIEINGSERTFETIVPKFRYLNNLANSELITITSSNVSEIDTTKSYGFKFVYIPKGISLTQEDIDKYCNSEETLNRILCIKRDSLKDIALDSNVEAYVNSDSINSLMFDLLIKND